MRSAPQRHHISYHGTSSANLDRIRAEGLTAPGGYVPTNPTLAASPGHALEYARYMVRAEGKAGAKPVLLRVEIPSDEADLYLHRPERQYGYLGRSETVWAQRRPIPPEYIHEEAWS